MDIKKQSIVIFIFLVLLFGFKGLLFTDDKQINEDAVKGENEIKISEKFKELGFGIGISVAFGDSEIIKAELVNGIVRISEAREIDPRLVLETHFFFRFKSNFERKYEKSSFTQMPNLDIGFGPFVCVLVGSDDFIDSVGAGLMLGFRRKGEEKNFNIGIGYMLDTKFTTLSEGIEANKVLPEGETEIRLETKSKGRLQVIFSFKF